MQTKFLLVSNDMFEHNVKQPSPSHGMNTVLHGPTILHDHCHSLVYILLAGKGLPMRSQRQVEIFKYKVGLVSEFYLMQCWETFGSLYIVR